jgi:hypothetical protein
VLRIVQGPRIVRPNGFACKCRLVLPRKMPFFYILIKINLFTKELKGIRNNLISDENVTEIINKFVFFNNENIDDLSNCIVPIKNTLYSKLYDYFYHIY